MILMGLLAMPRAGVQTARNRWNVEYVEEELFGK
jgi:hypothetical protein